jgi:hypothetical protein
MKLFRCSASLKSVYKAEHHRLKDGPAVVELHIAGAIHHGLDMDDTAFKNCLDTDE